MYACYRREDAADAVTMLDAAAAVLADYPEPVIRVVTDPRTGLPGRCKWPPNIAEIREACEREFAPIARENERRRRAEETRRLLGEPEAPRGRRLSLDELRAKYGPNWGINPAPDPARPSVSTFYREGQALTPSERKAMYAARGFKRHLTIDAEYSRTPETQGAE